MNIYKNLLNEITEQATKQSNKLQELLLDSYLSEMKLTREDALNLGYSLACCEENMNKLIVLNEKLEALFSFDWSTEIVSDNIDNFELNTKTDMKVTFKIEILKCPRINK